MTDGPPSKPVPPKGPQHNPPPAAPTKPMPKATAPTRPVPRATPAPATARRTVPAKAPAAPSRQEVVVSGDEEQEESQLLRPTSVRAVAARPGLSLRWKIVLAMGGITVATAILIFVMVYTKAVGQLDAEIDSKGLRVAKTLASMDSAYWMYAIYQSPADRQSRLDFLLNRLFKEYWGEARKEEILRGNVPVRDLYKKVIAPLGVEKREVASEFREKTRDAVLAAFPDSPRHQEAIRAAYEAALKDPTWLRDFNQLVDPFREPLVPLKGGDVGKGSDIFQVSVQDITRGETDAPAVAAVDEEQRVFFDPSGKRIYGDVEITDGRIATTGTPIRLFRMSKAFPAGTLRFNVALSLDEIDGAKSTLRWAILLSIFVTMLLGIGVAIWVSTLITEPMKILMQDMNQVSGGDLDHETVPVSHDEIGMLATTFNRMTQALRVAHEQELDQKALEHELSIASEIQANLVPKRMLKIPGYDIGAYYRPSKEVGGDYYDFIAIDEEHEGVIVADVSGKGIPGSMVMSMARAFIRMEAERSRNISPADTLMRANRMLAQDIKKGMFVTALYYILNKRTNEIRIASAGHNPLVLWRAATKQIELVNPSGIALGFDKGPVFERTVKEEKIVLNPGDRMVAYTDGVVEMMDAANQEFGDDKFCDLVKQLASRDSNQLINLIVKAVDEHRSAAPQHDDMTIVTMRYLGSAGTA